VTLSVDDGMGGSVPFDIDSAGNITTAGPLDFETQDYYSVQVTATDPDNNTDTAWVDVWINDVNENPVFNPDWYEFNVDENSATGTLVGTVSVSDPQGQSVTLSVDDGMGGSVPFDIDSAGNITTAGPLDFETQDYYSVQVTATDPDNNTGTAWVDVWVNDVNENPVFTANDFEFVVAEDVGTGTLIGTVGAFDPQGQSVSYDLIDPSGALTINTVTGELTIASSLDFEVQEVYSMTATATDPDGNSSSAPVELRVTDVEENPVFESVYHVFGIDEDAAIGTSVVSVPASDPQSQTISYSISDPTSTFSIDGATGEIAVAGPLDAATQSEYSLTITATDTDSNTALAHVTVFVNEVFEGPFFSFPIYYFDVDENVPSATFVGSVIASDPESQTLGYSLDDPSGLFAIDSATGEITVTGALDYETVPWYSMTVTATDPDGNSGTAEVGVTINDVDDALLDPPEILAPAGVTSDITPLVGWFEPTSLPNVTYELQITNVDLEQLVYEADGLTGVEHEITWALAPGYQYSASMRTANGNGDYGASSSPSYFSVALPDAPTILGPESPTVDSTPLVTWAEPESLPGESYQLQVYNVDVGELVYDATGLTGNEHELPVALSSAYLYSISMRTANANGEYGAWTAPYDFSIALPEAPFVTGPPSDTAEVTPTVTWTAVEGAETYNLTIYDVTTGEEVANVTGLADTSHTPVTELTFDDVYWASVQAVNAAGEAGNWSDQYTFVVSDQLHAKDDVAFGARGEPVTVAVLLNDSTDALAMNVIGATDGAHGSVTFGGSIVTYTPNDDNFVGTDTFTYAVEDTDGATATATVYMTIGLFDLDVNNDGDLGDAIDGVTGFLPGYVGNQAVLHSGSTFKDAQFVGQKVRLILDGFSSDDELGFGADDVLQKVTFDIIDVTSYAGFSGNTSDPAIEGPGREQDVSFSNTQDLKQFVVSPETTAAEGGKFETDRVWANLWIKDYGAFAKVRATLDYGGGRTQQMILTIPESIEEAPEQEIDKISDQWERDQWEVYKSVFGLNGDFSTNIFTAELDAELADPDGNGPATTHKAGGDGLSVLQEYRGFILDGGFGASDDDDQGQHIRISPAHKELLVEVDSMQNVPWFGAGQPENDDGEAVQDNELVTKAMNQASQGFTGANIRMYYVLDQLDIGAQNNTERQERSLLDGGGRRNPALAGEFVHLILAQRRINEPSKKGSTVEDRGSIVYVDALMDNQPFPTQREKTVTLFVSLVSHTIAHELTHTIIDESSDGFDEHGHVPDGDEDGMNDEIKDDGKFLMATPEGQSLYEPNWTKIIFSDTTRKAIDLVNRDL